MSGQSFGLGTFSAGAGAPYAGVVADDHVIAVSTFAPLFAGCGLHPGTFESLQRMLDEWATVFAALEAAVGAIRCGEFHVAADDRVPVGKLRVHAPIPRTGSVYCAGANYKKHVAELIVAHADNEHTRGLSLEAKRAWAMGLMEKRAEVGTPFVFLKPQSSVAGPFDNIAVPAVSQKPDWELELAVVIGRRARRVPRDEALSYVAGYTIANDITLREKVFRRKTDSPELGMDFVMSKGAPGFLPLGPWLVPAAFVPDPQNLQLTLALNGQVMQDESTADMIFSVAHLIEYLSTGVELQPGDVICTGSPAGNGMHYGRFLQDGDELHASITGLGAQRNRCVLERSPAA